MSRIPPNSPDRDHNLFGRAFMAFGRSKPGTMYVKKVSPKLDPVLLRATRGRFSTIMVLPLVVTGIVIIVQNSLALAFALAGIAGAVRFKNSLKSSGDALFILISVGIGLAAGIGAVELALVLSTAFNIALLLLWTTEYGERAGMKRYMADLDPPEGEAAVTAPGVPGQE